ncbi:MAG: hypothetical protein L0Y71_18415 [Gemmataceae bacterium]|nr:hypothetical protein [Gemmataceae bacterium]
MIEAITFGLAYAAYVLLCGRTLLGMVRQGPAARPVTLTLAAVAVAHVALVWHHRLEWSLVGAWSRNPPAFVIFHTALLLIVAGALATPRWSTRLIWLAFPIVSAGALGAVFRREVVAPYRWPVVAAFAVTVVWGSWLAVRRGTSDQACSAMSSPSSGTKEI